MTISFLTMNRDYIEFILYKLCCELDELASGVIFMYDTENECICFYQYDTTGTVYVPFAYKGYKINLRKLNF